MRYEDSGVNIDRANRAKAAIGKRVKATWGAGVLSDTGAFGGLFALDKSLEDPVLVSSIDGVGTKLLVALKAARYDTVGQDLVNHCVNDILVQGARPLFFLDYFATGSLQADVTEGVIDGLARGCEENGCALIGGETAEMPGVYQGGDFDLAGCIVGVVERKRIIDGSTIRPGDLVLGLGSNGLHTNGYSLVRRVLFEDSGLGVGDTLEELGSTVGEELLRVHKSYLKPVSQLNEADLVKGLAHITGGGIVENLPRILPSGCGAKIDTSAWRVPPVFTVIEGRGQVDRAEMFRVFNMGIGMIVVVERADAEKIAAFEIEDCFTIGEIVEGNREVDLS